MSENNNNNLQDSFGKESPEKTGMEAYDHQNADKIIEKTKDILGKSKTGHRLLTVAREYGIKFSVINNKNISAFPKDTHNIVITAPADMTEPSLDMVLDMGVAIRDAEQDLLGFGVPDESGNPVEIATAIHVKEMDKLSNCCAIAYELINDAGITKILDEIKKMGHIDVYRAYVNEIRDADNA